MSVKEYDIVILGGGPAGLSAAIYAARSAASVAVIDISMFGGQPSNYLELENYPGFSKIGGYDLMEKFEEHADMFSIDKYPMEEIQSIDLKSTIKLIKTLNYEFKAKSVIIATGAKAKKLGIKGEDEFLGRGVSYCAVCDGAFYRDKIVSVVGGGNAAVEEAMYLTKFAQKVYLIHRRNELRADKIVQERAFKNDKLEFIYDTVVTEIQGENLVNKILLENVKTHEKRVLNTDGIFPYIGFTPNTELINNQLNQNESGFIITDETMNTNIAGVYAIGDVRNTPLRQVITAAADGAVAAIYASKYIETLKEITVK
ncbi:thioredoxin-disulfide reductase [bacterium]|nr:thioredoxin-disulfide reductase [bacterium]